MDLCTCYCAVRNNLRMHIACTKIKKYNFKHGKHISVVVKALCYKPEGRGFETDEVIFFFFSYFLIHSAALGPGVHSASNGNESQKQKNNVSGE
jgi:hypothetical protein